MVSVMLYHCMVCVSLSMDLFVFCVACLSDSVCELFGETIRNMCGWGCNFVVECHGVVWCGLIHPVWSSKECVCCAGDPTVRRLYAPSKSFFLICRKLSPHLRV